MSDKMSQMNERFDSDYFGLRLARFEAELPIPPGYRRIEPAKPQVSHYSYSNQASQGALIVQAGGFHWYNPKTEEYIVAYADRICSWDSERFSRACKIAGSGEEAWAYHLPGLTNDKLIEFAKVALNLEKRKVLSMRVVHWYNVASGYSCPTVEAIVAKE